MVKPKWVAQFKDEILYVKFINQKYFAYGFEDKILVYQQTVLNGKYSQKIVHHIATDQSNLAIGYRFCY